MRIRRQKWAVSLLGEKKKARGSLAYQQVRPNPAQVRTGAVQRLGEPGLPLGKEGVIKPQGDSGAFRSCRSS